jgi:hypothetical protein
MLGWVRAADLVQKALFLIVSKQKLGYWNMRLIFVLVFLRVKNHPFLNGFSVGQFTKRYCSYTIFNPFF